MAPAINGTPTSQFDNTSVSSTSWAHTIPAGSNKMLVVMVAVTGGVDISSITWNTSESLTQVGTFMQAGYDRVSFWKLANPTSTTANINVTFSASTNQSKCWAIDFTDAAQVHSFDSLGGSSTGGTGDITATTKVGDYMLSLYQVQFVGNTISATGGQTIIATSSGGGIRPASAAYELASSTSTVASWSNAGSADNWAFATVIVSQGVPDVTTSAVTNNAIASATGNGNVTADGGSTIIERGVCWGIASNPTILDSKSSTTGTTGAFSVSMGALSPGTHYYVRAYAINASGNVGYGGNVEFDAATANPNDVYKDISASDGEVFAVSVNIGGSVGTVTMKLGSTGSSTTFNAGSGVQTFQGTYSGLNGIIFTKSGTFNGTIDDLLWVRVKGSGTLNWSSSNYVTVSPIESEVFFKRIEDELFNSFRLYRFLDLLFKDLDGYVTVTLKAERNDGVVTKTGEFVVGNTSSPASPFSKKRISMLCKDQAIIIGLSNASLDETFAIAKFVLSGHKRTKKMFSADKIISVG